MQRDRFFTGILIGIGVLVAAALILFFVRQGQQDYGDESQPEGVLRNYIFAIQRGDYERAYSYTYDATDKPDFLTFQRTFLEYQAEVAANTAVDIQDVTYDDDRQTVMIRMTLLRASGNIFDNTYREVQIASLAQSENGWKIYAAPYPFWVGGWITPDSIKTLPATTPAP